MDTLVVSKQQSTNMKSMQAGTEAIIGGGIWRFGPAYLPVQWVLWRPDGPECSEPWAGRGNRDPTDFRRAATLQQHWQRGLMHRAILSSSTHDYCNQFPTNAKCLKQCMFLSWLICELLHLLFTLSRYKSTNRFLTPNQPTCFLWWELVWLKLGRAAVSCSIVICDFTYCTNPELAG